MDKPVPGIFTTFEYQGYQISVILTREFVRRYFMRKPNSDVTEILLRESIKEPLDTLISMRGTTFLSAVLQTTKTKISIVMAITKTSGEPPRIQVVCTTIFVGQFFPRDLKDYPYEFQMNPTVSVSFEREYEPALVQAVMDDLESRIETLKSGSGYHLGDEVVDYIAEVEDDGISIPDARWMRDTYVYEIKI